MANDDAGRPSEGLRPAYRRAFETALQKGKQLLDERSRLARLARRAYHKTLDEEDAVRAVKDDLLALARLVRAWANGDYRQVSRKTILAVIGAVLYFVSPIDAIPDFIPVAGLADDVAVVAAVVRAVRGALDRFRQWETARDERDLTDASSLSPEAPLDAKAARGDGTSPGRSS
ncbi:MAG: hypothetical protein BRD29_00020 [Bacteroidetes bacterium QH_2_67_10]|nr:MAG: hypothetical protein BRD29_00020 [Bacteroidetes bacterium QH_2_67_10]